MELKIIISFKSNLILSQHVVFPPNPINSDSITSPLQSPQKAAKKGKEMAEEGPDWHVERLWYHLPWFPENMETIPRELLCKWWEIASLFDPRKQLAPKAGNSRLNRPDNVPHVLIQVLDNEKLNFIY